MFDFVMRLMSNPVMNYIILSQGMGIPVGKLALYTVFGGVRPSACLPITIDVGTNNEQLLKDKFYIGLRQKRATGEEYYNFLEEFMKVVKQIYGEKVLVQYEDIANHDAFELLVKYGTTHLVFNDDIQGTAVVVLAGLVASLKLLGWSLVEHTFLFFGAGEAGTGIAEIIALAISKKTNAPVEEALTTNEIDKVVHQMIINAGAYPSPLGYGGFPKSVCISVNE